MQEETDDSVEVEGEHAEQSQSKQGGAGSRAETPPAMHLPAGGDDAVGVELVLGVPPQLQQPGVQEGQRLAVRPVLDHQAADALDRRGAGAAVSLSAA